MKKLIKKIILISLPVVALVIALEFIARDIPTSYSSKHNNLIKKIDKIEVLVLGSSHSNMGINPEYFGREAFNISNTSQGIYQDYKVLLKYLPECKNVKMVIIPISYFSLQYDLSESPEVWRSGYYSVYMGLQANPSSSAFELKNYSAFFLWDGPLEVIKKSRKINKININEYGYQAQHKNSAKKIIDDNTGRERVEFHHKIMKEDLAFYNVKTLNKIIYELKKRNIKIIFVTTPVCRTYYDNISKKIYDKLEGIMVKLSNENTVEYYNYFYDKRFDVGDFSDNDHLNENGAKKFSLILKNEVIDKMLRI